MYLALLANIVFQSFSARAKFLELTARYTAFQSVQGLNPFAFQRAVVRVRRMAGSESSSLESQVRRNRQVTVANRHRRLRKFARSPEPEAPQTELPMFDLELRSAQLGQGLALPSCNQITQLARTSVCLRGTPTLSGLNQLD